MEVVSITKILGRFTRADYPFLFEKWPTLSAVGLSSENAQKLTKRDLFEAVSKKFKKKKPPPGITADLDLLYLQRYSNRKLWKVHRIEKMSRKRQFTDADSFEEAIANQMCLYFNGQVHVTEQNESYWVRLWIEQPMRNGTSNTVTYIVYPKNSEYLLITNLKASHRSYLLQVLLMVFEGQSIDAVHLSGKHLSSMLQLIINKHNKKKPVSAGSHGARQQEDFPSNIRNENKAQKRKRDEFVESNFGPTKQPKLETLEYKLETNFKGGAYVPEMASKNATFHCRVKFQGDNVLEGIKNLAVAGLAELPMKEHLANVHRMAQNKFILRRKSSAS